MTWSTATISTTDFPVIRSASTLHDSGGAFVHVTPELTAAINRLAAALEKFNERELPDPA